METIVIQGLDFNVPTPYAAGHVLAENEASALNQLLHENLRNNFASKVKKAKEEAGDGEVDHGALQAALDEYASTYSFGVRSVSGIAKPSMDPVRREALKLATEAVRAAIKAKGLKGVSKESIEQLATEAVDTKPEFTALAEKRLADKREAASVSLSSLLAG